MPLNQAINRTAQKLRYAKIHLDELENSDHLFSNNAWECAHEESCLAQIHSAAVDGVLQELNEAYQLGFSLRDVKLREIRDRLPIGTSPALDELVRLRGRNSQTWLGLLGELRNHGTHRKSVGKNISLGTKKGKTYPNQFFDPRTNQVAQFTDDGGNQVCPNSTIELLKRLIEETLTFVMTCRGTYP